MNETQRSLHARLRMTRIKKVIKVVRFLISSVLILMLFYGALFSADLLGLHLFPAGVQVSLSPLNTFRTPLEIPAVMVLFAFVRGGLFFAVGLVLFWWLDLIEAGRFFNGASVRYFKWIGWLVLVDWLVARVMDLLAHGFSPDLEKLVVGLFLLLVAWIMDAAREIQEEQSLTV
jgi:hypothetical protein